MGAKRKISIGIDLGGTKVAVGVVDSQGRILSTLREKTEKSSPRALAKQLARLVAQSQAKELGKVCGIGLAAAGPLDVHRGVLIYPSNFPDWKRVPIISLLRQELHRVGIRASLAFQNDAIAAALGEGWVGAAKRSRSFVVITVGTGIGSGVIFEGRPLQYQGMGSEWGNSLVSLEGLEPRKSPYPASVEGFASGRGIHARAKQMGFEGPNTEALVASLRAGEKQWQPLFDDAALALAMLCYNLSLSLRLEQILFSGGLLSEADLFLPRVHKLYGEWIAARPGFRARIGRAKLGKTAGIVGAARLIHARDSR